MADAFTDAAERVHAVQPAAADDEEIRSVRSVEKRFQHVAPVPLDGEVSQCVGLDPSGLVGRYHP
jgi:hypothetical protein